MKNPFTKEIEFVVYECQLNPHGFDTNKKSHEDDPDPYRLLDSLCSRIALHRTQADPYSETAMNCIEFALPDNVHLKMTEINQGHGYDTEETYTRVSAEVRITTMNRKLPGYVRQLLRTAGVVVLEKEKHNTLDHMLSYDPVFFRMKQNVIRGEA